MPTSAADLESQVPLLHLLFCGIDRRDRSGCFGRIQVGPSEIGVAPARPPGFEPLPKSRRLCRYEEPARRSLCGRSDNSIGEEADALIQLDGIHHISATTADAACSVDFYARLLGLRLAKKTVNQDEPTAYHLLFGDEAGSPGTALAFFEHPNAARGVAGGGRGCWIVLGVGTHKPNFF